MAASMNSTAGATGTVESLIIRLHDVNAVKFGDFTLKSGIQSPVYFDLRVMISHPQIMVDVATLLWNKVSSSNFKIICGVPYTALPIATLMSSAHQIPMLIRRKEAKSYGTKKLIEGNYEDGDVCLVVEDVVSSGSSVLETAQALQSSGIIVKEAVVLLNRDQGGYEKLASEGIHLHSVFTMADVLRVLSEAGKMSPEMVDKVSDYLSKNKFQPSQLAPKSKVLGYRERAKLCSNPITQRLFEIMEKKRTNLALSADLTDSKQLLQLIDKTGPHVCIVKTHIDILEDFSQDFIEKLSQLATKHEFLIFEDRKFADIGNTVVHQFRGGVYHISNWAHIINAHTVPGPGVIQGLKTEFFFYHAPQPHGDFLSNEIDFNFISDTYATVKTQNGCGCLLIAEMSSAGNLATGNYTQATVKIAEENKDFVMGFISVSNLSPDPELIHMTPGVQLECGRDDMGQQYLTPSEVIKRRGSDVIIVGRGIYQAPDPVEAAKQFQVAGYDAFVARLTEAMIS